MASSDLRKVISSIHNLADKLWNISIDMDRDKVSRKDAAHTIRSIAGSLNGLAAVLEWYEIHDIDPDTASCNDHSDSGGQQ